MDLNALLKSAVDSGATDMHLKLGLPPVVRLDGQLGALEGWSPLTEADLETVLVGITERTPQRLEGFRATGELDTSYMAPDLARFRVNGFKQRGSTSFAFRMIPTEVPGFEHLGLPKGVQRLAEEHRGLILVTGATGAGKTTTLASMIGHINRTRRQHIVTIEDPIEILHRDELASINQREVGQDTESFLTALRAALRQDPDVILIGEMRDSETVRAALQAAETGHLVMSTLHTVDATETVNRVIDFFPPYQQKQVRLALAGTLRGIICQRLVPTIDGGRTPGLEILINTGRVAERIADPDKTHEIKDVIQEGGYYGMVTFDQSLLQLLQEGKITVEDAMKAVSNQHDFQLAMQQAGIPIPV